MKVSSKLWIYVFAFLDEKDLVSVAGVCYEWWEMIFRIRDVLSDGFRVGGTGSFATRKFVSFRPTEDVYCFDQPKFVFHSDLKSSFAANNTGCCEFG